MANSRASCVRHVISEGCVVCCCAWLRVYAVLLHLLGVSSLVRLVYSLGGIIACTDLGSRNIPCESCCVPFISVAARFGEGLLSFLLPSRFSARIFGPSVIVSRASTCYMPQDPSSAHTILVAMVLASSSMPWKQG
ncbi:hypothetical protein BHE74_00020102 [Ensete ventricosum]|nr:hypothetical protein BHE74_00020102 [Ensete ventricosum]